jgi:putative Mn2+ efflux pump MntP
MGLVELLVLGVALSADAFAVTLSNTFVCRGESRARMMLMPVFFGFFQGFMPVLGYFLGGVAAELIESYAGIITLVILGVIGGNMICEGVTAIRAGKADGAVCETGLEGQRLTVGKVFVQAIATAIDAFAVGVSLRALAVDIVPSAAIIAATTFLCCVAALFLGRRVGDLLGDRAEVVGGVVLVLIGVKAFIG